MRRGIGIVLLLATVTAVAERVGTSEPALSLTEARVRSEVHDEPGVWLRYLQQSAREMREEKAVLAKERVGLAELPPLPEEGSSARAIPLQESLAYYRTEAARSLGERIVSFQTPAGGWSKNLLLNERRLRGQSYAPSNLPPVAPEPGDFDTPQDPSWHYMGTLDNDATWAEMRFLARLATALPAPENKPFEQSFERGLEYLLQSQYPNGGWPQVWPLEGGYHDAITLNDDAMVHAMEILRDVAQGEAVVQGEVLERYGFVSEPLRRRAAEAELKAVQCLLKLQVRVGRTQGLSVWAQQYDPLTLQPVSARNFEPAALSAGESASAVRFLMAVPHPSQPMVSAVEEAMSWFAAHRVDGFVFRGGRRTPGGRRLVAQAGSVVWPRYVSLTTGKALFADRNKGLYTSVMDLSDERRNGYGWYGDEPAEVIAAYPAWRKRIAGEAP